MGGTEVPTSGIALDGKMYVAMKSNNTKRATTANTLMTRYNDEKRTFEPLHQLSSLPDGHFITTTLRLAPPDLQDLPIKGPNVLVFGSGQYRRSNAYLSVV